MPRTSTLTSALVGLTAAALAGAALSVPAPASAAVKVKTLETDLFSPLSLAVGADGSVLYSQNFAGVLQRRSPKGKVTTVFKAPKQGQEIGAVSERRGSVRFALSGPKNAFLYGIGDSGKPRRMADIGAHERKTNPDERVSYGFRDLDPECAASLPAQFPAAYPGIVESHPYATYLAQDGTTYVADAAANAIFSVPKPGVVRTVAVLPAVPVTLTEAFAEASELPACVVGETYRFESVPTDVEMGPDGKLYVTTLPGGPEDDSLGANASVYRVNPRTGATTKVVSGLVSATGLAVARNGDIYVAELFRGRIARAKKGSSIATTFVETPLPGDVEVRGGSVYATTGVLTGLSGEPGDVPAGRLVRIDR
jgi:hypothetical protein